MFPIQYPIQVSDNGRYFVDRDGQPVFWLGTTQWELFRQYTQEDARLILEKTRDTGFTFAQIMIAGVGDGTQPNLHGDKPWIDNDPLAPNEAYFKHVDAVVEIAREYNIALSVMVYHQRYQNITLQNARAWARGIAERYRQSPNLVWSMCPEAKPEFTPLLRELAAGLQEGDGGAHLKSVKPDPSPYSSSCWHEEPWLDFNDIQTWKAVELIYPMVTNDYRLAPTKPVLMGEGAYEDGSEYGFDVTPLWVRRQAYYSYLAGGHHAYGHNDSWRVLPTWKSALDAPGAVQMGILKQIFLDRPEWWKLAPDQTLFASGGQTEGPVLNLAARHPDGRWIMAYLAEPTSFSLHLEGWKKEGERSVWIDPRSGGQIAWKTSQNQGVASFSTPEGWEDALLVLEASEG